MANLFQQFLDTIRRHGLEFFGRYYSVYRGTVVDNKDEKNRGRIVVKVPAVTGDSVAGTKAYPIVPFAGQEFGMFFPPPVGGTVYVVFEGGDPRFPLYLGGWWKEPGGVTELPTEFRQPAPTTENPVKYGIKTPGGHYLLMDDTAGAETLRITHKTGAYVNIDMNGSILIQNAAGSLINVDKENQEVSIIDAAGNGVRLSADGISLTAANQNFMSLIEGLVQIVSQQAMTIQAGDINLAAGGVTIGAQAVDFSLKGTSWMTYFNSFIQWATTHTHPTPAGPSSPPLIPPTPPSPTVLSRNVKIL